MPTKILRHLNQRRSIWRLIVALVSAVLITLMSLALLGWFQSEPVAQAQGGTFDSGSNGSDGVLNLTTPGTYVFDPPHL